jgi:hypothetical protein
MLAAIFHTLKNYHPMQKIMSLVIGVYKFGQEFYMIGIFQIFCTNIKKPIPTKAAKNASLQHAKNYMQPAQIRLHPAENFLHPAKI